MGKNIDLDRNMKIRLRTLGAVGVPRIAGDAPKPRLSRLNSAHAIAHPFAFCFDLHVTRQLLLGFLRRSPS